MTMDRSLFDNLVFTVVDEEDEPVRWRNARSRREKDRQSRPVPSCVPDLSLGAAEWVYILCLGEPTSLDEADLPNCPDRPSWSVPVSYYVGWTGRPDPRRRITEHGGGLQRKVVAFLPNFTRRDETMLKVLGGCPGSAAPLNYFREAWELHHCTMTQAQRAWLEPRAFPFAGIRTAPEHPTPGR